MFASAPDHASVHTPRLAANSQSRNSKSARGAVPWVRIPTATATPAGATPTTRPSELPALRLLVVFFAADLNSPSRQQRIFGIIHQVLRMWSGVPVCEEILVTGNSVGRSGRYEKCSGLGKIPGSRTVWCSVGLRGSASRMALWRGWHCGGSGRAGKKVVTGLGNAPRVRAGHWIPGSRDAGGGKWLPTCGRRIRMGLSRGVTVQHT